MRVALTVLFVFLAQPAAACHKFSRWHYPYPQRCSTLTARSEVWSVELTRLPESWARELGIDQLRKRMK
jgi:hypothetical protein